MARGDIPPRQIPAQRSAVGTFSCAAKRDTSPKGRQKRLSLLYFAFYFSLAFIFLFSFPCPHDGWMQGIAQRVPASVSAQGDTFPRGVLAGPTTAVPWRPLPCTGNGQMCHDILRSIFIMTNLNKKCLLWAHAADLLPSGSGSAPALLPLSPASGGTCGCLQVPSGILGALGWEELPWICAPPPGALVLLRARCSPAPH